MQLIVRFFSVVCGILLLVSIAAGAEGQWELIMSKDGIDTYKMTHPGTNICTFKGIGFVDARIEIVGEVLRDIPVFPEWMTYFKQAKTLKTIDRNTYIFYGVVYAPFPYKNRDLIIENRSLYDFKKGIATIKFSLAKDYTYPKQECCLRINDLDGQFYLEYFGKDKTQVTFDYRADPSGNIPVSIANEVTTKDYPAISISGLRKMVKKEKYINGGLASPEYNSIERMMDNKKIVSGLLKKRVGEIIIDPGLMDIYWEMSVSKKLVTNIHTTRGDFETVRQGVVDLFNFFVDKGSTVQQKQELNTIAAYLANKNFDNFISMKKFMLQRWLVDGIVKDNKLIPGIFDMESSLGKVIFEKITTSRTAVTTFIKDKRLAERILTDASLRKKLWEDKAIKDRLNNKSGAFKSVKNFETFIAERVKSYSS